MLSWANRVLLLVLLLTTRDAIDTHFTDTDGQEFTMIDTAGMRKSGIVYENTERNTLLCVLRIIDRSQMVLMVTSAEEKAFVSTTSVSQDLPMKLVKR